MKFLFLCFSGGVGISTEEWIEIHDLKGTQVKALLAEGRTGANVLGVGKNVTCWGKRRQGCVSGPEGRGKMRRESWGGADHVDHVTGSDLPSQAMGNSGDLRHLQLLAHTPYPEYRVPENSGTSKGE